LSLPGSNSEAIRSLFKNINPSFVSILEHTNELIGSLKADQRDTIHLNAILRQEPVFLAGMDSIVAQYAEEAHEKVFHSAHWSTYLWQSPSLLYSWRSFFIFRPTTLAVTQP